VCCLALKAQRRCPVQSTRSRSENASVVMLMIMGLGHSDDSDMMTFY
jgi:hypothetical protein